MNVTPCYICFNAEHEAKDCPTKQADLDMVGPMAAFVAARLNYVIPMYNKGHKSSDNTVSTIKVDQHKEKFYYARVYCTLAHPDLVAERWNLVRADFDPNVPPPEFREQCALRDALHYRLVYLDMLKLVPERVHKRLIDCADYRELLYPTVSDAYKWIDDHEATDLKGGSYDSLASHRERYGAESNDELKTVLRQIYEQPPRFDR